MIYECSCGGSININSDFFFHLSQGELDYRCSERFNTMYSASINPWVDSILSDGEQETKTYNRSSLDNGAEEDEDEDDENDWNDTDYTLSGDDYEE